MEHAGAIIGMPFSLEGLAFFTEAIFLGIYLYAWKRIPPRAHLAAGVVVAISGALSGAFVVCANAWMNAPAGFRMENGQPVDIDPIAAMFNPAAPYEVLHMTLAAFAATGFAVAGVHAFALLRGTPHRAFHRAALQIALMVGVPAALLQPLSGDLSARDVAERQPVKLAAMEGHLRIGPASFVLGGWIAERTLLRRTRHHGRVPVVASDPEDRGARERPDRLDGRNADSYTRARVVSRRPVMSARAPRANHRA